MELNFPVKTSHIQHFETNSMFVWGLSCVLVGSLSCSAGSAECQSCGIASGQVGLVQAQGAPFLGSAEPDEAAEGSQCGMMEWLGSLGI